MTSFEDPLVNLVTPSNHPNISRLSLCSKISVHFIFNSPTAIAGAVIISLKTIAEAIIGLLVFLSRILLRHMTSRSLQICLLFICSCNLN